MNAYIKFKMLGFKKHYEQNDCVLVWEKKDDYEEYMSLAHIDTLSFVVSNTTEAVTL